LKPAVYVGRGSAVQLGTEALATLLAHRQLANDAPESGGVLLGRWILGTLDVVVDSVTVPMPGDVGSRYAFFRSAEPHQAAVDLAHEQSNGTVGYLGEWHTHAEPDPTPSSTDLDDWAKRLREDVFDGATLLFVIVGQERTRMWRGDKHTLEIVELKERSRMYGQIGYEAYGEAAGWKTFDGRPMPTWEQLQATETGRETCRRWEVAAAAIRSAP
jgi:integrative and conjugative element protein (TIGR02256 family)